MAENKFSPNDIPDLNQDWGQDINDELLRPYSGRAVQKLIKEKLSELRETKFGHVTYEYGALTFYDEDNGTVIASFALSGNIYTIDLVSSLGSNFTVITSDLTKVVTITPTSKEGASASDMVDFTEDYTWVMAVDNGTGFINVSNGTCIGGQSFSADIRSYLKVGFNSIRFSVTGTSSNQVKSILLIANLTSLTLNVLHTWQRAWIEGEPYSVYGIFFSGNMQKTLNVRIDDDDNKLYTQVFSASTSYVSSPFAFNLTDYFPETTGIHKLDIWISGTGVETSHFIFDVMCVKSIDKLQAKLVCLNEVKSTAFNYEDQELFQFATYGTDEVTFNITANDVYDSYPIVSEQTLLVRSEEKVPYALRLEIPTEESNGVSLSVIALADTDTQEKVLSVDNSNALAPVSGADFYMNASLRANGPSDRELIINNAKDPVVYSYPATWSGFTWENDGWGIDSDSVKCLSIQAGSSITVDTFKPLSILGSSRNLTIEWKLKVDNVADYNTPIMTLMSDETYNELTTNGIIIYPTSILVLSSANRNIVQQRVLFEEGHELHFVVVFQRNYGATGRNLCRISINGIQQCVFEYDGSSSFGNGYLKLGQESTDLYLYMLRYYNDKAFEADSVLKNWLNSLTETIDYSRQGIRSDNDIFDGTSLNYELAKQKGFNTMVVEMPNDIAIPSLTNNITSQSTLAVEYNDHPEWNFKITNAPVDGQGTTSKRYYRWNLRWKLAKGTNASIWTYADGSTSTTKGWFDGNGNHLKTGRITAKKNIASSSQGHKMGATAMYDDLYKQLGLSDNLPTGSRVAVYQYPVLGFQKYMDESYQFIGLYTIGPDKGDKDTFGYDTSAYPDLLSIEGPNHAPLGTRFLHPWIDAEFSLEDETLKFGGEEAWDVASYNDSKYADAAQVLSLYEAEWKPAYDLVYFCSTYLRSIAETGLTLEQINANKAAFRNASNLLTTRRNEVVTLYDENYNLVYYRNLTSQYEVLVGHDVRTYLDSYLENQVNPTTEELITARKAKFLAEVEDYFDIEDLLYHECFLMLIGASDNHAKNMYPFKLETLATGGRWQFRQDDLDTILATDNNGNPTKEYYVEPADLTTNGTDIYQGSSSVLWTLLRETSQVRLREMMVEMINGLASIASSKGLAKGTLYETIFAMFNHYFWQNSAKYFPVRAYAEDTTFSYVYVWSLNPGATYNGVYPLTQALGTQLEAEMHWSLRRILYLFSKYSIGGFNGSADDGLNSIEFTPGQAFTFNLTPAINMYPSGNLGGGTNIVGTRTAAGDTCQIVSTSDGTTTYYLKGLDWLTSLGDLSRLVLTSRGGVSTINFSVKSKRLRSFKVGDSEESNVLFNATTLAIQGEGLQEIDVQNVKTITSPVDLSNCPRLKVAKFQGSSVPAVLLPTGSKINYLSLPRTTQNLYLNGLPILADAGLVIEPETFPAIRGFYVSNCPNLDLFNLLRSTLDTPGHALRFISLYVDSLEGTADDLTMLSALTTPYNADTDTGYGRVVYDSVNKIYSYSDQKPYLQGTINVSAPAYERDVLALRNYFNVLNINVSEFYLWIEDLEVRRVLVQQFGDGNGVLPDDVYPLTNLNGVFSNNTDIQKFNELSEFTNIVSFENNAFDGCSNFSEFNYPNNGSQLLLVNNYIFRETAISSIIIPPGTTHIGNEVFCSCNNVSGAVTIPDSVVSIGEYSFALLENTLLTSLSIGSGITVIKESAFEGSLFSSLDKIPSGVTIIEDYAFYDFGDVNGCGTLLLEEGSLYSIGDRAFFQSKFSGKVTIPSSVQILKGRSLSGMDFVTEFDINGNIAQIGIPGHGAITACPLLTKITYPASVTIINQNEASNCASLSEVIMQPPTPPTLSPGFLNGSNNAIVRVSLESSGLYHSATGWSDIKSRIFPYEGTYLLIEDPAVLAKLKANQQLNPNSYAFIDRDRVPFLTSIYGMFMGDTDVIEFNELTEFTNITSNDFAFNDCTNLQSVPFSNFSIIGESMFDGCSSLTGDLDLSNATIIGPNAFRGCSSLSGTLSLSSNLTSVGAGAFPIASSITNLALGVDYDLDVYNDFSMTAWSVASLNQSILNCKAGTSASRKRIVLSSSSYSELSLSYPSTIADAESRFIDVVKEGFIPLIAPASFESPTDFALYGEDMDLVKAFNEYPSEHKKYAFTVNSATTGKSTLPVVPGRTYAYKEEGMSSYIVTSNVGTGIGWTWAKVNRHVIVLNTGPTETIQSNADTSLASWIYVGPKTVLKAISESDDYLKYNNTCRYIHVYSKNCVSLVNNAMRKGLNLTGQVNVSMLNAIPDYSFRSCAQLNGVLNITSNITSIGREAFRDATGITGLIMSDYVTSMSQNAFTGCAGLTSISLSNSLTKLDVYMFSGCTSLAGVITLPNSITVLELEAFASCSNVISFVLPSNLQSVKNSVFRQCSGLVGNFTFPATIIEIGGWVMQQSTGLTSITCLATTPPAIASSPFPNTIPIYVPAASVDAYKAASGWSAYASRIFAI